LAAEIKTDAPAQSLDAPVQLPEPSPDPFGGTEEHNNAGVGYDQRVGTALGRQLAAGQGHEFWTQPTLNEVRMWSPGGELKMVPFDAVGGHSHNGWKLWRASAQKDPNSPQVTAVRRAAETANRDWRDVNDSLEGAVLGVRSVVQTVVPGYNKLEHAFSPEQSDYADKRAPHHPFAKSAGTVGGFVLGGILGQRALAATFPTLFGTAPVQAGQVAQYAVSALREGASNAVVSLAQKGVQVSNGHDAFREGLASALFDGAIDFGVGAVAGVVGQALRGPSSRTLSKAALPAVDRVEAALNDLQGIAGETTIYGNKKLAAESAYKTASGARLNALEADPYYTSSKLEGSAWANRAKYPTNKGRVLVGYDNVVDKPGHLQFSRDALDGLEAAVQDLHGNIADMSELGRFAARYGDDAALSKEIASAVDDVHAVFGVKRVPGKLIMPRGSAQTVSAYSDAAAGVDASYHFPDTATTLTPFVRSKRGREVLGRLHSLLKEHYGGDLDAVIQNVGSESRMSDFGKNAEKIVFDEANIMDESLHASRPASAKVPGPDDTANIRGGEGSRYQGDSQLAKEAIEKSKDASVILGDIGKDMAAQPALAAKHARLVEASRSVEDAAMSALSKAEESLARVKASTGLTDVAMGKARAIEAARALDSVAKDINKLRWPGVNPTAEQLASPAFSDMVDSLGEESARAVLVAKNIATIAGEETKLPGLVGGLVAATMGGTVAKKIGLPRSMVYAARALGWGVGRMAAKNNFVTTAVGHLDNFLGRLAPAARSTPAVHRGIRSVLRNSGSREKSTIDAMKSMGDMANFVENIKLETNARLQQAMNQDVGFGDLADIAERRYLYVKQELDGVMPWDPRLHTSMMSASVKNKMKRVLAATADPRVLVRELEGGGMVHPDTVRAVASVFPTYFSVIKSSLLAAAADGSLSGAKLRMVDEAFGLRTSPSFVLPLQANHLDEEGNPATPPKATRDDIGSVASPRAFKKNIPIDETSANKLMGK
jgi:hypothetical protein